MHRGIRLGDNHKNDKIGSGGVGYHPLAAIEHPLPILQHTTGFNLGRIR